MADKEVAISFGEEKVKFKVDDKSIEYAELLIWQGILMQLKRIAEK